MCAQTLVFDRGSPGEFVAVPGHANAPWPCCVAPCSVRVILRCVLWPSAKEHPNRSSLRLRWDALTEGGDVIVANSTHPEYDAAHLLMTQWGLSGDTLVTFRHEGLAYDSFNPQALRIPARLGLARASDKARLAKLRLLRGGHIPRAGWDNA